MTSSNVRRRSLNSNYICAGRGSIPQHIVTLSQFPGTAAIGRLSDKILLKIFRYFLDDSPRDWPRLVHICRKWRHIVFASQELLHLRLFCTHGTPVLTTLHCWPTLPIIVQFGGVPDLVSPVPRDWGHIVAALKQPWRVSSISLTVSYSLLQDLSTIFEPFSELEELVLLSRDMQLSLPLAFQWGTRLRKLHATGIDFPSFLWRLTPSRNLVNIQLHDISSGTYMPPEFLLITLSRMTQLQSLSLHFLSATNHTSIPFPWTVESVFLPSLTRLDFRGMSVYLARLVATLDAPYLEDIKVVFFECPISDLKSDLSKLSIFINRIETHKSHRQAHILSFDRAISTSLIQPGASMHLELQFFDEPLRVRLLHMAQIHICFSDFLLNVEDLWISTMHSSSWDNLICTGKWQELIDSFKGVKRFHGDSCTFLYVLLNGLGETLLPALHKLHIPQPGPGDAILREAVALLMISRQLSGHPIGVEYERLGHNNELLETGTFSEKITIEMLSDDILLNIFRHYLDASPRLWPVLACVCQGWRQIMFTSPLGLNLRLYCTYGTPILKTLDCWPALPIIVQYGGSSDLDPPSSEDDVNIFAALKQSGRVSSISLTVTRSLLEKLSTISEPFSELEELVLLSKDNLLPTLPSTFRWGPRLRTLHSTGIAFPLFPQLLLPSQDLVDLQLHEIPSAGYFSPESFANALSGMTELRTLSFHFLSLPPRRNFLRLPPPSGERTTLPALTCLKYRGTSKYLDSLVARIDAPHLENIDIRFFSQPTMDASQLGRFIERIETQTSLIQADIESSAHSISISLTNPSASVPLRLQISCKNLDWQLSCMAQVCAQLFSFLFGVKTLRLNMTKPSSGQDDVGLSREQWLELIRAFGRTEDFHVAGVQTDTLCAVLLAHGEHTTEPTVLPALRNLNLHYEKPSTPHASGSSWDAVQSLITSRWLSGRPVQVYARKYSCHICYNSYIVHQDLRRHLEYRHSYRVMCAYCNDFQWSPGSNPLFRNHLEEQHSEVACSDITPDPLLLSSRFSPDSFVDRHSSLIAPDVVASSTTAAEPHPQ